MSLSNYNTANWTYDAKGTKLRSTFFSMSPYVYYYEDYCGSFVFRNNQLERVQFDEGYITLESSNTQKLHYYLKDHQGNVRLVVENGPDEQMNEYYPYGGLTYNSDLTNTVQPYKYNGKELDRIHGLDMYDYGARQYDPNIGRFMQVDPLAEKYYHLSPYAYCGNNPVNAVDPDGSLILFINGFHTGDGASSSYWGGLDSQIMQLVEDYNVEYIDGSMGGIYNSILSNISNLSASQFGNTMTASNDLKDFNNLYPSARFKIGELYGFKYAKEYFGRLKEGETIKLVTHSMGAAFAKGLIQGLQNFANSNDINAEGLIESELDLAPYQPDKQTAASNVATTAISHLYDWIARYKPIKGASN